MLKVIIGGEEFWWVSTEHCYFCYIFCFYLPWHIWMRTAAKCLGRESEYDSFLPNTYLRADIMVLLQELYRWKCNWTQIRKFWLYQMTAGQIERETSVGCSKKLDISSSNYHHHSKHEFCQRNKIAYRPVIGCPMVLLSDMISVYRTYPEKKKKTILTSVLPANSSFHQGSWEH